MYEGQGNVSSSFEMDHEEFSQLAPSLSGSMVVQPLFYEHQIHSPLAASLGATTSFFEYYNYEDEHDDNNEPIIIIEAEENDAEAEVFVDAANASRSLTEAALENDRYWLMPSPATVTTPLHQQSAVVLQLQEALDYLDFADAREIIQLHPYLARLTCCRLIIEGISIHVHPLHYVVAGKTVSIELMDDCISLYPAALLKPDKLGRVPLHLAARQGAPPFVIQALLRAQPKALRIADGEGNLPLHHAVLYQSSQTIQRMLEVYPDASKVVNHRRRTPLHIACASRLDDDTIVTMLLEAYPTALSMRDRNDKLPLHVLCGSQPRSGATTSHGSGIGWQWTTLQRIIAALPSACVQRDQDGLTPLKILRKSVPPYDLLYVYLRECTLKEQGKRKQSLARRVDKFFAMRLASKGRQQRGR
jgi:hypothetical protein